MLSDQSILDVSSTEKSNTSLLKGFTVSYGYSLILTFLYPDSIRLQTQMFGHGHIYVENDDTNTECFIQVLEFMTPGSVKFFSSKQQNPKSLSYRKHI